MQSRRLRVVLHTGNLPIESAIWDNRVKPDRCAAPENRPVARAQASAMRPARDLPVALLLALSLADGPMRTAEIVRRLAAPRSTLHRVCRILAREGLLDISRRGSIALGPAAEAIGRRREDILRAEDERRLAPRPKHGARAPGASYSLTRNEDCARVAQTARYRRTPRFRLGFSNASLDHPWRIAFVHSIEYGAFRHPDLVSSLAVKHAGLDGARQEQDIAALIASGVDGLIV